MADNSPLITTLEGGISQLPSSLAYGIVHYEGVRLGVLSLGTIVGASENYDAFDQTDDSQSLLRLRPLSQDAEDFVLSGSPVSDFEGDGIVPKGSQRYYEIPNFPGASIPSSQQATRTGVVHTEETKQVSEISDVLRNMVHWWNN